MESSGKIVDITAWYLSESTTLWAGDGPILFGWGLSMKMTLTRDLFYTLGTLLTTVLALQ